jgi:hypothetical protein
MLLLCALPSEAAALRVIEGTTSSGHATDLWLTMIQALRSADPPPSAPKLLTSSEREWTRLIQSRTTRWESEIPSLARNFRGIDAPAEVHIVLGNRDGEDAFTHDATTIGFDVSRLASLYGDATLPENANRMDRFFRHEYVHLLQKAWLTANPYTADTPLRAALLAIWKEGLGNYYSLSARWRTPGGEPSATARETLSELEPRFVARLAALACAPPSSAAKLTADLSMGTFDRKWGALPVALWLDDEVRKSEDALREFVSAGPDGIWTLAERHLGGEAPAVLREVRTTAALCHSP